MNEQTTKKTKVRIMSTVAVEIPTTQFQEKTVTELKEYFKEQLKKGKVRPFGSDPIKIAIVED